MYLSFLLYEWKIIGNWENLRTPKVYPIYSNEILINARLTDLSPIELTYLNTNYWRTIINSEENQIRIT